MQYVIDKKWKWVECNLVIKRLPQKEYHEGVYESLEAEVELMSDEADIRNFESQIIMQKSFEFQQGRGFIWHKSWYIPEIVLKLSPKVTKMLKQENHIKKIYCQMLSGYPFKKDEHFYLQQVKLDGDTLRQFNRKGQVTFSNVKFSQTSFNKNVRFSYYSKKNKFSIILLIYTSYKQNERSIIKSYISSPIHVDSRKQARKKISANTFIQDEISINKFLTKLEGAQKLVTQTHPYQQLLTLYGFIKYYTAANIRFKIKHPYYIGYHFHDVFDVYYNSEEAKDPADVLEIIYQNERKENEKAKTKTKEKKEFFTDNKEILKKSSPKILLFLIKNAPKQCLLIKDEFPQSQQKIQLPSAFNKELDQKPENMKQNKGRIIQKPYELERLHRQFEKEQQNVIENGQNTLVKNCLVHIIQPASNKPQNDNYQNNEQQNEQKQAQQIDNNNETSKIVKQQENSEFGVQILSKNGDLVQPSKMQQKKIQLVRQEEAIKKIYSIFESWKFNFIHLKKSDGGLTVLNKKWVHVSPQEILQSFKTYTKRKGMKSMDYNKGGGDEALTSQVNGANPNSYLVYDIHQVIVLQKGKKTIVKIQDNVPSRQT